MSGDVESRLVALGPRPWAQLLRALRRLPDLPSALIELLTHPTSELASGARRVELCRTLAGAEATMMALLADSSIPEALHAALAAAGDSEDAASDGPPGEPARSPRSEERSRALRRQLDEERRRREGAEARASVAETRAAEAAVERDGLTARVAELESEVARGVEAVAQASARVERRSAARIAGLERELAGERSTLAALRRDHERTGAELETLRQALEDLRDQKGSDAPGRSDIDARESANARPLRLPDELGAGTTEAARWLLQRARLLLVDGYNVAFALRAGRPLEEQRRWLIDRLRPLAARGAVTPVVVFDGDGAGSARREPSGVEVRFTARGTLADDDIVFVVAATAEPVVVITDDAELRERVRAEGGNVLGTVELLGAIDA